MNRKAEAAYLVADNSHTTLDDFIQPGDIKVGHAYVADLPRPLQLCQPLGGVHILGSAVIVPVELHKVQGIHAEASQRAVN